MFYPRAVTTIFMAVLAAALPQIVGVNGHHSVAAEEYANQYSDSEVVCCSRCGSASCYGNCDSSSRSLKEKIREHKRQKRREHREHHRRERFLKLLSQFESKKLYSPEWSPFCAGHFGYFQTTWRPSVESPQCSIYPGNVALGSANPETVQPLVNSVPPVPASVEYSQQEPVWSAEETSSLNQQPTDFWESVEGGPPRAKSALELQQRGAADAASESQNWIRR